MTTAAEFPMMTIMNIAAQYALGIGLGTGRKKFIYDLLCTDLALCTFFALVFTERGPLERRPTTDLFLKLSRGHKLTRDLDLEDTTAPDILILQLDLGPPIRSADSKMSR